MYKLLRLLTTTALISFFFNAQAAVDPSSLVKVTKDNNPQCIEFYTFKGDLYCNTNPSTASSVVDPQIKDYEKQVILFDDRPWQAIWGKQTDEITTVEYVPAGNNIEKWHELVTSQFIPGLQNKATPKLYADAMIQQLKDSGFKPIVSIVKDTPDQVIFEFRIVAPDNLKQDELQIITKGKDGFYVLHYVIKEADMGQKNREAWLRNLQNSKINH